LKKRENAVLDVHLLLRLQMRLFVNPQKAFPLRIIYKNAGIDA